MDQPPDPFPFSPDGSDPEPEWSAAAGETPSPPRPRHGGSILMAAMLGLAEAMGMAPEPTEVVQVAENDEDGLDLTFGDLPPLD